VSNGLIGIKMARGKSQTFLMQPLYKQDAGSKVLLPQQSTFQSISARVREGGMRAKVVEDTHKNKRHAPLPFRYLLWHSASSNSDMWRVILRQALCGPTRAYDNTEGPSLHAINPRFGLRPRLTSTN
jgi:hypothetical protein